VIFRLLSRVSQKITELDLSENLPFSHPPKFRKKSIESIGTMEYFLPNLIGG
jgi:hypothetical protein